jgi:mRNA interferase RelE/StbE
MAYQISFSDTAKHDMRNLQGNICAIVRQAIRNLISNPQPSTSKKLRGETDLYRLRLDKWRVIYKIDEEHQLITILTVRRKIGEETYPDLDTI